MSLIADVGEDFQVLHMKGISVMSYTHLHPQWELYFCPGRVRQRSVIHGEEYVYQYPCAILSKPYAIHSMSCLETEGTDFERYVFYFSERTLERLPTDILPRQWRDGTQSLLFELEEEQAAYLCRFLRLLEEERFPTTMEQWESAFGFFLQKLLYFCGEDRIIRVGASAFYLQDVMRYISEELSVLPSAEEIAKRFSVSRSKLDRDFKEQLGMTLHDFVSLCRLNYAKRLLHGEEERSVGDVALLCGFQNENYFSTFFKGKVGLSPGEFRRVKAFYPKNTDEFGEVLC